MNYLNGLATASGHQYSKHRQIQPVTGHQYHFTHKNRLLFFLFGVRYVDINDICQVRCYGNNSDILLMCDCWIVDISVFSVSIFYWLVWKR